MFIVIDRQRCIGNVPMCEILLSTWNRCSIIVSFEKYRSNRLTRAPNRDRSVNAARHTRIRAYVHVTQEDSFLLSLYVSLITVVSPIVPLGDPFHRLSLVQRVPMIIRHGRKDATNIRSSYTREYRVDACTHQLRPTQSREMIPRVMTRATIKKRIASHLVVKGFDHG